MLTGLLLLCVVSAQAVTVTVEWDCNPESDMKMYGLEFSRGSAWGLVNTILHKMNNETTPCVTPRTYQDTRYIAPGLVSYRLFAVDKVGQMSVPIAASITIPNVGPGEEAPLPYSMYDGPPPTSPPPSPPPPPPQAGDYVFQSQFSGTQGYAQWSYRDTSGALLTYNASGQKWNGNETYLAVWSTGFHHGVSGAHKGPVVRWTAPGAGTARVRGNFMLYETPSGATASIKHNATSKFSQTMTYGTNYPYDFTVTVAANDTIDFSLAEVTAGVNNNTQLNPTISFTPVTNTAPTVSSFSPTSGSPGTSVTITGANFTASATGNTVRFGNIAATVSSATTTSIVAVVPQNAVTGVISVETTQGSGSSASSFTVPLSGVVGDVTDLRGNATSQTSVSLTFTALSDGQGNPSIYDIRFAPTPMQWGAAPHVTSGTCTPPYAPNVVNQSVTCTVTGLTQGTEYQFQVVGYRGTPNVNAVYSNLSNQSTITAQAPASSSTEICFMPGHGAVRVSSRCGPMRLWVSP